MYIVDYKSLIVKTNLVIWSETGEFLPAGRQGIPTSRSRPPKFDLVGDVGFEPTASRSRTVRATAAPIPEF